MAKKKILSDRILHPEHYRDDPVRLEWSAKDLAWCEMALDYLPFLELRLKSLNGSMGERLYASLNKDLDRLALSMMHCDKKSGKLGILQLLFHRLRIAVVTGEKQKAQINLY